MKNLAMKAIVLLSVTALVLSGCLGVEIRVFCDRLLVNYTDDEAYNYFLQVFRLADDEPISDQYKVKGTGSISIPFYEPQPEGTALYLRVYDGLLYDDYDANAVACSESGTVVTWFEPGDNRINRQAYAYASIYCDADNGRVGIYGIHSAGAGDGLGSAGSGFPAIFVPYAELPDTPTDGNLLIAQYQNIRFYRLTSGEYQVNAGPDAEGKEYVLVWDGCPSSYIRAYILQNGVLTPTEIYPR